MLRQPSEPAGQPVAMTPAAAVHACDRFAWLSLHHCEPSDQFDRRSDAEASRFIADLRTIGCEVHTTDPTTGVGPITYSAVAGHFAGQVSGVALGLPDSPKIWHVLIIRLGDADDLQFIMPEMEAESQVAMNLLGIDRAMYVIIDPSTHAIHGTRFTADTAVATKLLARVASIVGAAEPPPRIADAIPCATCSMQSVCYESMSPAPAVTAPITCRNCVHSTPRTASDGGRWRCDKHARDLSSAEQAAACDDHLIMPHLLEPWATPIDAGYDPAGDWTEYQTKSGVKIRNSRGQHDYASRELAVLPVPLIGAGTVDAAKSHISGCEAISSEDDYRSQAAETFQPGRQT